MARIELSKLNKLVGTGVKITPADLLLKDLNKYIIAVNSRPYHCSRAFKPSSMQCKRNMFYQLNGALITEDMVAPEDVSGVRIGECGTDAHERIQQYLIDMGNDEEFGKTWEYYDVERFIKEFHLEDELDVIDKRGLEYKIYNKKYNIRFQTDGILRNKITGIFYIFEFKTETDMKFNRREGVDEKHHRQAISYCLSFHIDTGVIFLYEGRDFLGHKAYYFPVSAEMKQSLINLMDEINKCVKQQILPEKCGDRKICQYCEYQKYCRYDSIGPKDPAYIEEDRKKQE